MSNSNSTFCIDNDTLNDQYDKINKVLQDFSDNDLLRVKRIDRRESGHITEILNEHGDIQATMYGFLVGQDFLEGWRNTYTKWTNFLDDEYIEILLMINHDILPKLPEFSKCKNQATCNLDYFCDYKIKIKRSHVTDLFN